MVDSIINKILLFYIFSLYIFTYRPGLNEVSNLIAGIFVFAVMAKILVNKKKIKFNKFLLLFLLFIIICGISYYVAMEKEVVVIQLRVLALNYIFILALINYLDDYAKIYSLLRYFIYSGTIACIYIFLKSDLNQFGRIGGVLGNENAMGITLGIAFVFSFYLVIEEKRYIYILPGMIMLPTILLTGSRTAMLMLLINIMLMIYLKNRSNLKTKTKFIIFSSILLFSFYYLIFNVPIFYFVLGRRVDNLLQFLGEGGTKEGSILARNYMIRFGMELFKERPILGYGINNYRVLLEKAIGMRSYAHNNYVELLVGTGIIGASVFYAMYINILINLKKTFTEDNHLGYLFFVLNATMLLIGFSLVHYTIKHVYIVLAISSIILNLNSQDGDRSDDSMDNVKK